VLPQACAPFFFSNIYEENIASGENKWFLFIGLSPPPSLSFYEENLNGLAETKR